MDPDPRAIDDYIRENRSRYTDQAIFEQLTAAGHERAAINEAFGRARPRPLGIGDRASEWLETTSGLIGFAFTLFIIGGVAGLAGVAMALGSSSVAALPIFVIGYVGIGLALIALLRWAYARFQIGGGWASVVGFLLVPIFGALMFGTCVAAFSIGRG